MNIFEQALAFWDKHGTKALGSFQTFLGGLQAAVLVMNPAPPAEPLVPWKVMALVAGANAALGVWTVRRGFTNTAKEASDGP